MQITHNYFITTSTWLEKQREIYDETSVPVVMTNTIIQSLFRVMSVEVATRFLEEKPLHLSTPRLQFIGYVSDFNNINQWHSTVPFFIINDIQKSRSAFTPVMCLIHEISPYITPEYNITSSVLHMHIGTKKKVNFKVQVCLSLLCFVYILIAAHLFKFLKEVNIPKFVMLTSI